MPQSGQAAADDEVRLLKEHLLQAKKNHLEEVLNRQTLKDAHVYCVVNKLSAQQFGPLLEQFIRVRFGYEKVGAKKCSGDVSKNNKTSEIKVSLGGKKGDQFNYVQIRPSHDCDDYILTAYSLTMDNVDTKGEVFIFRVPSAQMKVGLAEHGSLAHGTIGKHGKITQQNVCKAKTEYAIRPKVGDRCWQWLLDFRVQESDL